MRLLGQSLPLTTFLNTFTLRINASCAMHTNTLLTFHGLNGSSTPSSDSLPISSTYFRPTGVWEKDTGTLTIAVRNLAENETKIVREDVVSWQLTNPSAAQSAPKPIMLHARWTYPVIFGYWERGYTDLPAVEVQYDQVSAS